MPEQKAKQKKEKTPVPIGVGVLRPEHAAPYIGVSVPTLARLRHDGSGPEWCPISERAIGYRVADLEAWLASRPRFRSTTQRTVAEAAA